MIYLIVMNLIGLAVMAMDKSKARHHAWRIPEKTLFLVSILGRAVPERGPACICFIIRQSTVFCGGNATYSDLTDMHYGIDREYAWVWDVINAWFAMFYKK